MAIEKARPKIVKLDMNPMVDMAFLLVTFFMLSTSFRTDDPTEVILPTSNAEIHMPEVSVMTIYVNPSGQVFFGIDGKFSKKALIEHIVRRYELELSEYQIENFSLLSGFGVPISELPNLLNDRENLKFYPMKGIPTDSLSNELADWVVYARVVNPSIRVAIKADKATEYQHVKKVIKTLLDNKILRFNLLTEKMPSQKQP
ncbi:biopolymer transporter ExbD [Thermaurantimonas aggregans]|uniref:Biopolymer transporter ExbD n=1 Tax=Thermaurantimonas aggregans TaxID=2173829 RepID=A0A401XM76_9FLAO|nr:biopolymer transporter ExbD [Thermaurantimonas aggregans]MCX8147963.1 biopolymer transporter ExbD [Thermaurantimonas aggregans]GCD78094.1 biopolymer transporter ExbD [Thermaurantimonas aggregans]